MIFLVFIGASASISDELRKLGKGRKDLKVIAPAAKKHHVGLSHESIRRAFSETVATLKRGDISHELCRLIVLSYPSSNHAIVSSLFSSFGGAAWIEFISDENVHKATRMRQDVEHLISRLPPLLHVISSNVFGGRKRSPLSLPLKNFQAPLSNELKLHWYAKLSQQSLEAKVRSFRSEFMLRRAEDVKSFADDRGLLFAPAKDTECHGIAHPTGASEKSFIRGKFRFGTSLFPGFHYDVRDGKGRNLQVSLTDADYGERALRPEKRKYINIHPNDVLLPQK